VGAEARFPGEWIDEWRGRGHRVRVARDFDDSMGHAHAIELTSGGMLAATDPRCEGLAAGL
jgi:gamma-glutamyltranspeptidase